MPGFASDIAFTDAVKAEQHRRGSRAGYARMAEKNDWRREMTQDLIAFLAERDSFYLATASAEGRPCIQHRVGPKGFLKAVDARTLAFADFAGNRQYITLGNLAENDRAFIFLMDYANRRRVKLWGRARVVEGDDRLIAALVGSGYEKPPERAIQFSLEAWDVNCPQHIVPRYDEATVMLATRALRERIAELEAEVARLRSLAPAQAAG